MSLNAQEREALDASLSPFKKGDIIADVKGELIGVFDNVAYHGGDPEEMPLGNHIFVDFQKAISKQGRENWHVFKNGCGDDDVYIDRRKNDLTENYRFATEEQIELFRALLAGKRFVVREKGERRRKVKNNKKK